MTPDLAQSLALNALTWILSTDDLASVFMGSTGVSADELRSQAGDPGFQAAVLDFLLMNDDWITGFCDHAGYDYQDPLKARQVLPGGELPNWT